MTDPSREPGSQPSTGGFFVAPTNEALAEVLPGYEILGLLGQGGMGAVYKARQINLDRIVAIKVLPNDPENDTMNFAERFQREARAMAKFLHSRIIAVFDFGKTEIEQAHPSGMTATVDLLYIVIEFVEGTDLSKILSEELLPPSQVINIFTQICDALSFAHSHDIVHRDIKPANIMLDVTGNVKVADFGLAKLTGESAAAQAQLTISGTAMGTPDYVAPEVLEMGTEPDHRVDIYALGVMLYQMLTGRIPRGLFRSPTELIPGLDPRLEEVIEKAMQADPDHRYQTVEEFWTDLDEIRTNPQPVDADLDQATVAMQQQPSSRVKIKPPEGSTQDVKVGAATHVEETSPASRKKLWLVSVVLLATLFCAGLFFLLKPSGSEQAATESRGNEAGNSRTGDTAALEESDSIDLLATIDLERDTRGDKGWQRAADGFEFREITLGSLLIPPVPVDGSYELELRLSRDKGHFAVTMPVGNSAVVFKPFSRSRGGFESIDALPAHHEDNPTNFFPSPLQFGTEVTFLIRVSELADGEWSIEAFNDGSPLASWTGDPSRLSISSLYWALPESNRIGLGLATPESSKSAYLSAILTPQPNETAPNDLSGSSQSSGEPIDLLAAIDLETNQPLIGDTKHWKREDAGYRFVSSSNDKVNSALVPEVSVLGNYDLDIEFRPHGEGMPNVVLPIGSAHIAFACGRSSPEGRMSGFEILDGFWAVDGRNTSRVPWTLPTHPSDSYRLRFRVRDLEAGIWRVECFLNGELHTSWQGDVSEVRLSEEWKALPTNRVGLMLSKRSPGEGGAFRSVTLTSFSGTE